jgi:hypothetical protein
MPKYHNRLTLVDGIVFHSQKEARRYEELKLNQQAGAIANLRTQVKYSLDVNRKRIALYVADFVYLENGKEIIEDVKGMRTPVYQIKKKLMNAIYGIEILET